MLEAGSETRMAVLVVDDSPSNLLALGALLSGIDAEVLMARSGAEALALAAGRELAVVLLDVMMPEVDGFETLRQMREIPAAQHVPVIFLTAFDLDRATVKRAYELGAVDYLTKPLDAEILLAKVGIFLDLKRRELQIQKQAADLRAKDRHIAILAHDLRNPLFVIESSASRLARHGDEGVRKSAARILRASTRMTKLAEDVLEFARAASKQLRLRRAEVDLGVLCRELVAEFESAHVDVHFDCDIPATVRGAWDAPRLEQALTNLLANAAKYGDGRVRLVCEATDTHVELRIENGGPGIPSERLDRVFEPFERASDAAGGIGLGLSIVREIARAHGGEVEAESREGLTTFRLRLPASMRVEAGVARAAELAAR